MAEMKEAPADAPLGIKLMTWLDNRFPSAFQGYREVVTTTEVEEVACIFKLVGYILYLVIQLQCFFYFLWYAFQFVQECAQLRLCYGALLHGYLQCYQSKYRHLGRERFS